MFPLLAYLVGVHRSFKLTEWLGSPCVHHGIRIKILIKCGGDYRDRQIEGEDRETERRVRRRWKSLIKRDIISENRMLEKERERHPRDKRDSASENQKNEKKKRA